MRTRLRSFAASAIVVVAGLSMLASGTSAASPSVMPASGQSVGEGEPWIAYQRWTQETGARLRLVRPDGTGDHALLPLDTEEQTHPDWSPDGDQIAYVEDNDIWVVDVAGSHPIRVFDCADPCIVGDAPAWSPDGRSIAFVTADEVGGVAPGMSIDAVDVASGAMRTLYRTVGPTYTGGCVGRPMGTPS